MCHTPDECDLTGLYVLVLYTENVNKIISYSMDT